MTDSQASSSKLRGIVSACSAYFLWGLFPIFWKQLHGIDATELIAHRIVWSLVFVLGITAWTRGWAELKPVLSSASLVSLHVLSGVCVSINWLTYVWGVNHGYVLESSLGYFLVPLVNVALGRFLLGEHLHWAQWAAIALAAIGVVIQLSLSARIPWIALVLAASWAAYGVLRKRSPLGSLPGLTVETALLTPVAAGFLLWRAHEGTGALGHVSAWHQVLVLSAGAVTAIPLLLFAYGVRRLRLSTIGFLQYIVPTMTFSLGVLLYHETLDTGRIISFSFIWLALVVYTVDNLRRAGTTATTR